MRVRSTLDTELGTLAFTLFLFQDEKQGLEVALYKNKWERRYHTKFKLPASKPVLSIRRENPGGEKLSERPVSEGFPAMEAQWELRENSHRPWTERDLENRTSSSQQLKRWAVYEGNGGQNEKGS